MPLVRVETNRTLPPSVLPALSRAVTEVMGKPERYVQVVVRSETGIAILHAGAEGPAAFVEVRSIGGLSSSVNRRLAERICGILGEQSIPSDRVYLNFIDVPASHWGHDGATFG